MKQITVGHLNYWWHKETETLYYDERGNKQVCIGFFNNTLYIEFLRQISAAPTPQHSNIEQGQDNTLTEQEGQADKFTEGEWKVEYLGSAPKVATKETLIADVAFKGIPEKEADANAKLIASAPQLKKQRDELREALTAIVNDWDMIMNGNREVFKEPVIGGGPNYWSPSASMVSSEFIAQARKAIEIK